MKPLDKFRGLARAWRASAGKDAPGYFLEYLNALEQQQSFDTLIKEIEFVVLDTETTGPDPHKDRVVSFAAVRVQGSEIDIQSAVDWKIRGQLPSSGTSIEIHGVLNNELEGGMNEPRFVEELTKYVGSAILVGYRPGFDMAMLNSTVNEQTGGRLTNRTLDVYELGMRIDYPIKPQFVNPEPYRLDTMCERYDIEQPDRHTAMGDAYATAILLLKQLSRLEKQGVRTLKELMRRYG
ncbi:MAG: PolC-type DNA polymerase III [Saprospiraceae bacterium]